jgi:UDP-N-acetylglucosamine 2-epimerase (non-hydrolysing)
MAPVYRALDGHTRLRPVLVSTGQHADLLDSAFSAFGLTPRADLAVMTPGQSLAETASRILGRLPAVLRAEAPAAVLVQGDTTTAFAAGLAAYYERIPVGHIEAGLRTGDLDNPFPEEANRQLVDRLCRWCFAPTEASRDALLLERIPAERVSVTGNTGIDALLQTLADLPPRPPSDPFVLMTLHRRESFGEPLADILDGLTAFLDAEPTARVVWPVHPNPDVGKVADAKVGGHPRVTRIPPQGYREFAALMADCKLMLTDSGGVQEEAPSLGKRVLIARDTTERPEAVTTGQNRLVGRTRLRIHEELLRAWSEPSFGGPIPVANPYGDGRAGERLVAILDRDLAGGPTESTTPPR